MLALTEPTAGVPLYQLKITLRDSRPPIWRRIIVPANIKLSRLHYVLQSVMPWTNSHLHLFEADGACYGDLTMGVDPETLDEKRHTLAAIAAGTNSTFVYEYDFGDGWEHIVVVEKVLPVDSTFKRAVCLAGKNACPPDDCGGMPGYYEMLKEWDAKRFEVEQANANLKRIKI
jgi:hypothetical protein